MRLPDLKGKVVKSVKIFDANHQFAIVLEDGTDLKICGAYGEEIIVMINGDEVPYSPDETIE